MPIQPAASYISGPLQPHLLYMIINIHLLADVGRGRAGLLGAGDQDPHAAVAQRLHDQVHLQHHTHRHRIMGSLLLLYLVTGVQMQL